ncbi:MAG: hypothetical protein HOH14_09180 [Gammaproteobacteria bacterium]|nr:hypothetical protein [Gammaproteobacteria bacterium]MBT6043654.1 hypothetical protein [Gammaproteobacteria bacterium]
MTPGTIIKSLKSISITAVKSLVFLVGLVLSLVLLAVGTEGGSNWTIKRILNVASDNSSYRFSLEALNGTLLDELTFTNFSVTADDPAGITATMENLVLAWNPLALFDETLRIRNLQVRQLVIDLGQSPAQDADSDVEIDDLLETLFSSPYSVLIEQSDISNITLRGEENRRIARITMSGSLDQAGLEISGSINLDDDNGISTRLHLASAEYAVDGNLSWNTLLAGTAANGTMNISGSLAEINLQHKLMAPVLVETSGLVTPGLFSGNSLAIDLRHQVSAVSGTALSLPALEFLEDLAGVITTRGSLEQLDVLGELEAQVLDFGLLIAELNVTYQAQLIQINQLALDSEKLTIAASGNYTLASENSLSSSLSLNWNLDNFTDGDLLQDLELVSLAGNGSVNIDITDELMMTMVSIDDLAGDINSFPLTGSGDLALSNGQLEQLNINLEAGGNVLALNGSLSPELNLDWRLQAPALSRLLFSLDGMLNGEGRLSGSTELPRINGSLSGSDISYRNESIQLQLDALEAQARYDGSDNQIELNFANLAWGEGSNTLVFSGGELFVSGTLPEHVISMETQSSLFSLQARASGGVQNDIWNGVISAMGLQSDFGDWQLSQPLEIIASNEQASFSQHCWAMTTFSLCGQGNWESAAGLSGEVFIDNFPLSYINNSQLIKDANLNSISEVLASRPEGLEKLMAEFAISLPANSFIDGRTDVQSSFSGLGGNWASTQLNFIFSPRDLMLGVVIPVTEDEESLTPKVESYGLDEVQLDLSRDSGQWLLESAFQVYVPESGGLDFQGTFSGQASLNDNEILAGQFELDFNNIAWLEALVPNLLNPAGELQASGQIAGNLTRPLLTFDSNFSNGSFELPEFGLSLEEINLVLHSEQDNQITISGDASSGDGQVSFDSLLSRPFISTRTLRLEVTGENFEILNSPGTQVAVNPDLLVTFTDNVLDISGALVMQKFDLDISSNMALLGNGFVSLSRDVVVVNIPPELEGSVQANNEGLLGRIPVTMDVMLGLGEEVRFRGFGLDLNLNGDLLLEQSIDRPLLAYGELEIPTGNYSMYGQRLLIENGKLLFLGNPLNPALDIRALRNTTNAQVGLQMSGTMNSLQGQLFSTPALPESEILSLLVTGRSFQNIGNQDGDNMLGAIANLGLEKGQGLTNSVRNGLGLDTVEIKTSADYRDSALGLGKFIRPNLFMRYDIGLFDRENSLTLEYILSERLKMEVETGVSQSVDLTYTVEK